ncbi:MAG: hypothetical protein OXC80_05410 [Gammaproteobacteria bacterium]|nr:hypothetical protein [Gammaproteobacteria bacterium]
MFLFRLPHSRPSEDTGRNIYPRKRFGNAPYPPERAGSNEVDDLDLTYTTCVSAMREVADGFNGCYSDLAGFVKTLRKSSVESEPVVRLETQAGYQANMAFGTSKTPTSRGGGGGGDMHCRWSWVIHVQNGSSSIRNRTSAGSNVGYMTSEVVFSTPVHFLPMRTWLRKVIVG